MIVVIVLFEDRRWLMHHIIPYNYVYCSSTARWSQREGRDAFPLGIRHTAVQGREWEETTVDVMRMMIGDEDDDDNCDDDDEDVMMMRMVMMMMMVMMRMMVMMMRMMMVLMMMMM